MEANREDELTRVQKAFRPALMRYFVRRVESAAEAEDLTQEVFLRLANGGHNAAENLEAWIFTVAANLLRDRARRAQIRNDYVAGMRIVDGTGIDPLDPHRVATGREALATLLAGIDALPERTRHIFLMFRYEQMEQRTIAESFGISLSAVEKHIHRAMAALIAKMRDTE
jgi:RNA polymerase sigma-70 factor (ECF subfamily)